MHVEFVVPAVVAVFFSVLFLWNASFSMVESRSVFRYLSFFSMGLLLIFDSILIGFGVFNAVAWGVFESLLALNLIWIFVLFRRCGE